MKYIQMSLFVLLQVSCALFSADKTEITPLLLASTSHNKLIEKCIRSGDKSSLASLLSENPTLIISEDLVQLAFRKKEKADKNCCRNLNPLVVSIVSTVCSSYIALQPFACRPMSGIRVFADVCYWSCTACTTAHAVRYTMQSNKDWGNYFASKSIVDMLTEYKSAQKAKSQAEQL